MILLYLIMLVVFWPDFVAAVAYVRGLRGLRRLRRQARDACANLDSEYERLLRSNR